MSASPSQQVWTTRTLLDWMSKAFSAKGLDSPKLSAEILLTHVIGGDRLRLYMETDRPATPLERQSLRDLVTRALKHEPVQYLTGQAFFFGMEFHVDHRVLIPRPSTETIVEHILQHTRAVKSSPQGDGLFIADVCTGSGCIAISLMKHLPHARAVATDLSEDALVLAHENAVHHSVETRIDFLAGDLLEPILNHPAIGNRGEIDYLVSNPPYIPDHEWDTVEPNVKDHEPALALRGGTDGLSFINPIIENGIDLLKPGGQIIIEVADSHAQQARDQLAASPVITEPTILKDFEGLDRVIVGTRKN